MSLDFLNNFKNKRTNHSLISFFDNSHEQRLIGIGFNSKLQGNNLSFDFFSIVCLWSKYAVWIVHVVKLKELLNKHNEFFPVLFLMKGLAFYIFPMERGSLFYNQCTFFSEPGSSTTLKTLDLICARILDRHPLA